MKGIVFTNIFFVHILLAFTLVHLKKVIYAYWVSIMTLTETLTWYLLEVSYKTMDAFTSASGDTQI